MKHTLRSDTGLSSESDGGGTDVSLALLVLAPFVVAAADFAVRPSSPLSKSSSADPSSSPRPLFFFLLGDAFKSFSLSSFASTGSSIVVDLVEALSAPTVSTCSWLLALSELTDSVMSG